MTYLLQLGTPSEIKSIIATNDATMVGILIAVCIAFAITIVYLFKTNQTLYKEFLVELKANNEALIKVNTFQNEFVNNMVVLQKRK